MPPAPPPAVPLTVRRAEAPRVQNNAFFKNARARDGRTSPAEWDNSVKPNTTQCQVEKPLAGHTRNGEFNPRTEQRYLNSIRKRVVVGKDRTIGVTAKDRAATAQTNAKFFANAKAQDAIEKARTKK